MTRIGIPAIAAVAFALISAPAYADTDLAMPALFADGTFSSVDDVELAGQFGQGISVNATSDNSGWEGRLAVILWDETKPPITPNGIFSDADKAGGNVVINIGAGPGAHP